VSYGLDYAPAIWLVHDNDLLVVEWAFRSDKPAIKPNSIRDGGDLLRGLGSTTDLPQRSVLDLNMPNATDLPVRYWVCS
jgi:hypothetical protein